MDNYLVEMCFGDQMNHRLWSIQNNLLLDDGSMNAEMFFSYQITENKGWKTKPLGYISAKSPSICKVNVF